MIVKKMRASFGALHGTLELQPGMNLLTLPNEAGKSTWSAFLVAMLYGIDTSERANASNQGLPMKERYKPWDGRAMEGTIELSWRGRDITIERTTERRTPMGAFRAYETQSGRPVPELTGESCGRMLCGVERSVFERTAFIRQLGLPVTEDAALEKRLGALVSTGEEGGKSFSELEAGLKKYQNRRTGRAGREPRLAQEAERLRASLKELHAMQDEAMSLRARQSAARTRLAELEEEKQRAQRQQQARKRQAVQELHRKMQQQETLCAQLRQTAARLPEEAALYAMQRELDEAQQRLQSARVDAAMGAGLPEKPVTPACFAGLDPQQAQKKAAQDLAQWDAPQTKTGRGSLLWLLLAGGLAVLAAVLTALRLLPWSLLPLAPALASLTAGLLCRRRKKRAQAEREARRGALLAVYGALPPERWQPEAEDYAQKCADYARRHAAALAEQEALQQEVEAAQTALDALLARVRAFAAEVQSFADAQKAVHGALHLLARQAGEERTLEQLRRQTEAMQELLGTQEEAADEPQGPPVDEARLRYEYDRAQAELAQISDRLAARQGAISVLGDEVTLRAALEQTETALEQTRFESEAAALALSALREADAALRARFSPRITRDTGVLLARLTGGKYSAVRLEPDLRLSTLPEEGAVMRPAAAMSCGTADQMYLALRLAMCGRLLPPDVPLILDDALVNFDDARTALALELLEELAKTRQILFFTCKKL